MPMYCYLAKAMVFPKQNQLFKFDSSNVTVLLRNVISADGWYNTSRMVVVANGTMPGPSNVTTGFRSRITNAPNNPFPLWFPMCE
jgi:hypothetical protein